MRLREHVTGRNIALLLTGVALGIATRDAVDRIKYGSRRERGLEHDWDIDVSGMAGDGCYVPEDVLKAATNYTHGYGSTIIDEAALRALGN